MGMTIAAKKLPWYSSWKGLLGTKKPIAVFFQTRFGIHTFGMRYPIDIVIIDRYHTVKIVKKNLVPNRIFVWNPFFDYVLELPEGTVASKKIYCGSKVYIHYSPSVGGML